MAKNRIVVVKSTNRMAMDPLGLASMHSASSDY